MYIAWKKKPMTCIEAIANQHMRLIGMVNDLYREIGDGRGGNAILKIFVELRRYAGAHFETAERLMKQHGIRGKDAAGHLAQQDSYRRGLNDLKLRHEAGEGLVPIQVLAFVSQWWQEHILTEDRVFEDLARVGER
ncbi:bacteriohemerythrin [mine drainage metagenome]|uniref:Bacteriohemerythrin n=1 Tax=mine drainage metagenome TaxID=410659 RepID=A0A1J5SFZ7_9ZZZZ